MKKLTLLIALFFTIYTAHAQRMTYGLSVMPEFSKYDNNLRFSSYGTAFNLNIAALADYKLDTNWSIISGFALIRVGESQKNGTFFADDSTKNYTIDYASFQKYISIPLSVKYNSTLNEKLSLGFSLGTGFSYNIFNSNRIIIYDENKNIVENQYTKNNRHFDSFINITSSIGLKYKLNKRLSFEAAPNFNYFNRIKNNEYISRFNPYTFGIAFTTWIAL